MTTLAVTSVSSIRCHACTCFRIGSKFRCIRLTPTEMQSMSENDFECFASTGVNAREQSPIDNPNLSKYRQVNYQSRRRVEDSSGKDLRPEGLTPVDGC